MSGKTELLPCPFCGGEARHYAPGPIEHHIECTNPKCYAVTHGWSTEAEAIAAWNARAERTCEPRWTLQGKTQTQEFWRCECGNCGHEFGVEDRSSFPFKMTIDKVEMPNFCPNCGARVVA